MSERPALPQKVQAPLSTRFTRALGRPPRRLVVAVWGKEKTGKTHWALTAPPPIIFFDTDHGYEEVLPKFPGKEVWVSSYFSDSATLTGDKAKAIIDRLLADLEVATSQPTGTIVIDTTTKVWQLIQKMHLDKIKAGRKGGEIFPFDYADANVFMENIINIIKRNPNLHAIFIHRASEIYNEHGKATGKFQLQGFGAMEYLVQVVLHLSKTVNGVTVGEIESCRQDRDLEGTRIENITFDDLKENLIPPEKQEGSS